jgi:hypothetical protein
MFKKDKALDKFIDLLSHKPNPTSSETMAIIRQAQNFLESIYIEGFEEGILQGKKVDKLICGKCEIQKKLKK